MKWVFLVYILLILVLMLLILMKMILKLLFMLDLQSGEAFKQDITKELMPAA